MTSLQQSAELHRQIWQIVNGSVNGWDFKQYVLGALFYHFSSENFANFAPYPRVEHTLIIKMDYYGMTDGSIRMRVRAAVVDYMLQRWRVDCSPDHCLRGPEYRLWLKDHLAIYGVKNVLLAPGYSATKKADY